MHYKTKRRFIYYSFFISLIAAGIYIILYNLSGNISFFKTPSEVISNPIYEEFKLGGYVKAGSIKHINIDEVRFEITDRKNSIHVYYKGVLPAIFRDEQGAIVSGTYGRDGVFFASKLYAKHDERYMPKSK